MMEDRLNILETAMSAVAFDRMNLHFKKEPDYKFNDEIEYYGSFKIELILNYYQLPFHFFDWRNYDQLVEKEVIHYDDIKAFIKLIKYRSRVYLSKETKRDIKFIKKAIELKWDFEQLSKHLSLDLSAENAPYYWFLHYEILRKELITPEDFLEDIRLAEKVSVMTNLSIHKKFVDTMRELDMDVSKADPILNDCHVKMRYLFSFVESGMYQRYEKLVRLNKIF